LQTANFETNNKIMITPNLASIPPAAPGDLAVEPYISKKEVARRMGRTTRCISKMMKKGMIPYYKFGHRRAFRWSEIQSHLAQTCRVEGRE